jgi:hypothetical protein
MLGGIKSKRVRKKEKKQITGATGYLQGNKSLGGLFDLSEGKHLRQESRQPQRVSPETKWVQGTLRRAAPSSQVQMTL